MSDTHKPFRELIKPNSNFEFIDSRKTWITISVIAILASIAMLFVNKSMRGDYLNWTIDFKGGTELIFAFEDKAGNPVPVEAGDIRNALSDEGQSGFAVSDFRWMTETADGRAVEASGMMVRTTDFGAVKSDEAAKIAEEFYFSVPHRTMDLCLLAVNSGVSAEATAEQTGLTVEQVERVFADIKAKRRVADYLHAAPLVLA